MNFSEKRIFTMNLFIWIFSRFLRMRKRDIFPIKIKNNLDVMYNSVFFFFFFYYFIISFFISVREDVRCLFVICDWKDVEQLLCLFIKIMIINKLRVTLFFLLFILGFIFVLFIWAFSSFKNNKHWEKKLFLFFFYVSHFYSLEKRNSTWG